LPASTFGCCADPFPAQINNETITVPITDIQRFNN
jgi:hypothetical protein